MSWRQLHTLAKERKLLGKGKMHPSAGSMTKEILKKILSSEGQPVEGAGAAGGTDGAASSSKPSLASLLKPGAAKKTLPAFQKGGAGENITGMFMDVEKSGAGPQADKAAAFENDSMDGVIPSVAIDKFHQACFVLKSFEVLAVLLGKEQKFGNGTRFKRNVVNTMICGWSDQLTLELRCADSDSWFYFQPSIYSV